MSKASKPTKTNAARLLDSLGIAYETRTYEIDPEDLTAISVARKIDMPLEQVFKTLLTRAIIPGERNPSYFFAGDDGEEVRRVPLAGNDGASQQGLKDLLQRHVDLACDGDGGEVFGVDLVGACFVCDAERVEQARRVGLGGFRCLAHPVSGSPELHPIERIRWRYRL